MFDDDIMDAVKGNPGVKIEKIGHEYLLMKDGDRVLVTKSVRRLVRQGSLVVTDEGLRVPV